RAPCAASPRDKGTWTGSRTSASKDLLRRGTSARSPSNSGLRALPPEDRKCRAFEVLHRKPRIIAFGCIRIGACIREKSNEGIAQPVDPDACAARVLSELRAGRGDHRRRAD